MVRSHSYQSETPITGDELRKGDHVYVWRSKSRYSQHGIYVGDGMIVCFTNPNPSSSSWWFPRPCSAYPSSGGSGQVYMLEWKLFQGERSLYKYEYGVSSSDFKNKRAGTCTTAKSDPPDTVNHRAKYLLSHGYGKYDLLKRNCEDFALYCKTGLVVNGGRGSSSQAIFPSLLTGVGRKAFRNRWFGDGVVFDDEYRYLYDIGVREDKQRIGVEDVVRMQGLGNSNRPPTAIRIVEQQPRASPPENDLVNILIMIIVILTTILATMFISRGGAFTKQSSPNALPGAGPPLSLS